MTTASWRRSIFWSPLSQLKLALRLSSRDFTVARFCVFTCVCLGQMCVSNWETSAELSSSFPGTTLRLIHHEAGERTCHRCSPVQSGPGESSKNILNGGERRRQCVCVCVVFSHSASPSGSSCVNVTSVDTSRCCVRHSVLVNVLSGSSGGHVQRWKRGRGGGLKILQNEEVSPLGAHWREPRSTTSSFTGAEKKRTVNPRLNHTRKAPVVFQPPTQISPEDLGWKNADDKITIQ